MVDLNECKGIPFQGAKIVILYILQVNFYNIKTLKSEFFFCFDTR